MKNKLSMYSIFFLFTTVWSVSASPRQLSVIGGPRGIHPYLFKGMSQKNLVETARDHQWSIQFHKNRPDTLHVVAIRVEFAPDTSYLTTGNGLFGIRLGGDKEEAQYYDTDTTYVYDDLPHDSLYFAHQLDAVKKYYEKVSRGNLTIEYSIYPSKKGQEGYDVGSTMPVYSPGGKKRKESWDEYYERKTIGLITFVRDAIVAAKESRDDSPFAGLTYNEADKTIRDDQGRKTVFLIFHAGSSYLTDGGEQGSLGVDTPSDMIDAFITPDFFKFYKDTLKLDEGGVLVDGKNGSFLIDEIMMCSETSNQDGLNWGIQGIIVNQIARQLGIPDLFSTSSGISGIGSFCIMDFAGYSAAKGFIPPYPSAWVRAFMGWDKVYVAPLGTIGDYHVKALTSVLDRDTNEIAADFSDTTILLVPINDHEYYLIENRQRNLSGNRELFQYDTTETDSVVISGYPYVADIDKNVLSTSGKRASNVIQRVRNNDIGLPASGVLVWHVDERIIRNRMPYNGVNADSLYRGVSLVEADGIIDLGVMFQDIFYQAAFDYGGAEDVFPHRTSIEGHNTSISVDRLGPTTRPSTRANDGGHSYLDLKIKPGNATTRIERTALGKNDGIHYIQNFSDSIFTISVSWNYLVESWPRRAAPGQFYDPLLVDIDKLKEGNELFLLDAKGRIYLWSADNSETRGYNTISVPVDRVNLLNDTITAADTVFCFAAVPKVFTMPSAIDHIVYLPSKDGNLYLYSDITEQRTTSDSVQTTIQLNNIPSTYICNYRDSSWAIGCENGTIVFGRKKDTIGSVPILHNKPESDSSVCALAALRENGSAIVAIQNNGKLSIVDEDGSIIDSVILPELAIAPFSLVTADLDRAEDSTSEIIVSDSRHGMWVYTINETSNDLSLANGWTDEPTDWPSYYRFDTTDNRSKFPENHAPPAIADIDHDGYLDILIGGANGMYAFNYKGVLKSKWPAILDKRFTHWYQRGSIISSPIVVTDYENKPLVLFSSITGENLTFRFTKIIEADRDKGTIWFEKESGEIDSIWDLSEALIDTFLNLSDSIVGPYTIPGGILDAVNEKAERPREMISSTYQSYWPLTTGSSLNTSPLIGFMDTDKTPDLFAVSTGGWVYRWELAKSILPDTLFWPQTGYDAGRSFAFGGRALKPQVEEKEPITFWSFPNPTVRNVNRVSFKYKFSNYAENVRLDIFSYTGFKVYSHTTMGASPRNLTGSYPDWNILIVPLDNFGPGVYRCRLEAKINGKKHHRYWKMAVIK